MLWIIIIFVLFIVAGFGVSLYRYMQHRRQVRMAAAKRHAPAPNVPAYELNSWIDDEVATRKLYSRHDMSAYILAEELGISIGRLQYTIYQAYQKSVSDYLNDRRVQAACRLLREQPDMTIEDISIEVGCASLAVFRNLFSKNMGLSPDKYRNQMLSQ